MFSDPGYRAILLSLFAFFALTLCAAAQKFPDPLVNEPMAAAKAKETAVLAGGCFWGTQEIFEHLKGVHSVTAGYAGGEGGKKTAESNQVETGRTGHAESIEIVFDPSKVSYGQILKVFFGVAHDPTQLNRQYPDVGTQYRSIIFYANEQQRSIADGYIRQLEQAKVFPRPIVTEVAPLKGFYKAEDFHQDFALKNPDNPYIARYDAPRVKQFKTQLPELYK